jgi:hypothetical protein
MPRLHSDSQQPVVDGRSNGLGARESRVGKDVSTEAEDIVGIRYQAKPGEDIVA